MHTIDRYIREAGYVSKWWKYALIAFFVVDAIVLTTLAGCFDGMGDLGELYFKIADRFFYIGFME